MLSTGGTPAIRIPRDETQTESMAALALQLWCSQNLEALRPLGEPLSECCWSIAQGSPFIVTNKYSTIQHSTTASEARRLLPKLNFATELQDYAINTASGSVNITVFSEHLRSVHPRVLTCVGSCFAKRKGRKSGNCCGWWLVVP